MDPFYLSACLNTIGLHRQSLPSEVYARLHEIFKPTLTPKESPTGYNIN